MYKPVWTFEQKINLTLEQAESVLYDVKEGEYSKNNLPLILQQNNTGCKISKINDEFLVTDDNHITTLIDIVNPKYSISIRGNWWFKAEYRLLSKSNHVYLSLTIYNTAKKLRWLASLKLLGKREMYKKEFEKFAGRMEMMYSQTYQ